MVVLLEYFYCFVYVCAITFCAYPYIDRKPKIWEFMIYLPIYTLIDFIITYEIHFDIKFIFVQVILVTLSDFIMIGLLNRKIKFNLLFYTTIFSNLYNVIIVLIVYVLNYIDHFYLIQSLNPSLLRFVLVILFNLLSVATFQLFKKLKIIPEKTIVNNNYVILIIINLIVQFIYVIFQWINKVDIYDAYIHIILIVFTGLWILLLYSLNKAFVLTEQRTQDIFMNRVYQNIEQYMVQYEQDEKRIRKIKHDMKNHLLVIKELNDVDKIHEYVLGIDSYFDNIGIINQKLSGNVYIDAILNSKKLQYPQVSINYDIDVSDINIESIDLCTLLFNLIDNACSAADKINGYVDLKMEYVAPHLLIVIKNSKEGDIDFVSKKGKGHGYGMMIIQDIVDKYHGHIEYKVSEKEVLTTIVLIVDS